MPVRKRGYNYPDANSVTLISTTKERFPNEEQLKASTEAFANRKIYKVLDVATLNNISNDDLIDYVSMA